MRIRRAVVALAAGALFACTTDNVVGPKSVKDLVVSPPNPSLVVGDTLILAGIATDEHGVQFISTATTWRSSDPAVATFGSGGHLIAVSPGTTTVTATLSGVSATTTVTVTPPPAIGLSRDSVAFATIGHGTVPAAQTVTVANTSGGTLTGLTDSIAYSGTDSNWLQVAISNPTAPDTVTLAPVRSDLTIGTHTATVFLRAPKATNSPQMVTVTYVLSAGAPASEVIDSGNGQAAPVNTAVPKVPVVRVLDAFANPVPSVPVTFTVLSGGGVVVPTSAVLTDANGRARVTSWTLGTSVGPDSLTATAGPLPSAPVMFVATAIAGAPAHLQKVLGDSQTTSVGLSVPAAPTVKVTDQFGNLVANSVVTFSVKSGGGSVTGATPTTDVAGQASVGSWTLGTTAGTQQLRAGIATDSVFFTATATPDAASQLTLVTGNGQTATVGTAVPIAPKTKVTDQYGNPVSGVAVTFAIASGGGSVTGASAISDALGEAAVGSWTLGTSAGSNSLTATAPGLTGSPLTFTATGTAGAATQIALNAGNGQSATVNTAVATAPAVIVEDQFGNAVSGVSVTFAVASGGGTVNPTTAVLTNASGIAAVTSWTLGTAVGSNSLTASSTGLSGSPLTFTATATAAPASQVAVNGGNGQSATVNTAVAVAPSVIVKDQFGNPVAGVSVTFAVASGGGSITVGAATTNANGIATVGSWTLGTTAGSNTLTATSGSLTGSPVTFTATGLHGAATQIAKFAGDSQTAAVGTAVSTPPAAVVQDQFGNPVPGISVSFSVGSGGGSLTGGVTTTNASGIATVGSWTLGTTAGANTLGATSVGLSGSPLSFTATGTAGAATQMALNAGNGQTVAAGSAVPIAPSVTVRDQFNNPVAGVSVTFAVATGGGSVTGGNATTNTVGVATVGSWTLGTTAGSNSITATSIGLSGSPVNFSATGTAGAATQIALNAGNNQSATAGTPVAIPPSVIVKDQFNNPVSGVGVTFAVATGGGSVTGGSTTTNASGIATVGSWTLGTTAGTNTLTATSGSLTGSPVTFTATGTAGGATQVALNAGDGQTAAVGSAVALPPSVIVKDAFNNPVSGVNVTFAVVTGGGSVTGGSATTNAGGIATVGSWTLGTTAGSNTLNATSGSLSGSPITFTATATAGGATQIVLNAGNNQSATVGTAVTIPPSVIVKDAFNNPVSGVSVTFGVATGGGSLTGGSATSNASGIATVGSWTLGTTAGTNTLTATSGSLTGSPITFTATGTASGATQIALNAGNNQSATVGTAVAVAPSVMVKDQFNNPVSGVSVTFAVATGGGSVTGGSATTNASGIATVGSWTLGTTAGSNSLTATSGSLTGSPITFTATGTAGAATQMALNAGNGQAATVNTAVAVAPSVIVKDQFNNPVSGVGVTFAVATGGGSVTGGATTTNASGIATVGSWRLGTAAGSNSLTATSGSLNGSPVTFTATGTAGGASQIATFAGDSQSAIVGTVVGVPPAVIVKDQFGNPVAGVAVTFAVASGGGSITGASPSSNASGVATVGSWTLGAVAGKNTLTATSSGLTGSPLTFTATGLASAATTMAAVSGTGQTDTIGATLASPYVVIVTDGVNPVSGVPVTWAVVSGGGSLTAVVATTDVNGHSSAKQILGLAGGAQAVTASVGGLTGSPVTFTSTATHGNAASIALKDGSAQSDTIGATLANPYRVTVSDRGGNPVPGVTVSWAVNSGGGSITASSSSDASGIATATRTLGTTVGVTADQATATGLAGSPVAFSATITNGQAKTIALTGGNAQTDTVGKTLPVPYTVTITDRGGNPVSGYTVTWAVTSGGGSITPTSISNAAGVASASRTLGPTAGAQTATASGTGLTGSPVTFTATGVNGAAATIALSAGNAQTDTIGATLATPYSVLVTDAGSNPVAGVTVTWAATGSVGSITPSSITNASGIATATRVLGSPLGAQTATATVTGLTGSPVTFTATATAGNAKTIALNGGNTQTDTIGATLATPYAVLVTDRLGNPVSGTTVSWAATGGGGSITPSSISNASGLATATRVLGSVLGSETASATVSGLTGSPVNFSATATAGQATTIALAGGNSQTDTIGATLATPYTVHVTDRLGNDVSGTTVTWAVTGGGGSITSSSISDAGGIASATRTLGNATGANAQTATATGTGLTGSPVTFLATATAGLAANIALNAGNAQTDTINATLPTPYSVLVTDRGGNPVSGTTVTWGVTGGGGSITPSSSSNASGIASATRVLGTTVGAGFQTAQAGVTGLAGSPVTFSASAIAGNATTMALNAGDAQTDTIGATLATAYSVLVTDRLGNPVANQTIAWAATSGGGNMTPASSSTNALGIASSVRTLGTSLGSQTANATAALTGSPIGFTATATHGNPAAISVSGGDAQTDTIGATLAIPYSVTVTDRAANPVAGVTVNWSAGGGGSITTSSVTSGGGVATASRTLGTTAGTQTAQADPGFGVTPASFTATAMPGNAKTIALNAGNAQIDTIGATLATPLSVLVTDRGGNAVPGVTVTWTGSGGATPSTGSNTTNGSGIASVSLTLGTVAGGQGATATSGVLTGSPVNFSETGTAGHATQIAINGGNGQSATVNTNVATAPSAIVRDRANNLVQGTGVTFAVTGGGGSVSPTSAILTNSSGIAQVTSWTLGTVAGTNNNTLSATSGTLSGSPLAYTASATPGAVSAAQSTVAAGTASITACSTSCVAGTTASVITVTAKDQFGNPEGAGLTVNLSGSTGTNNSFSPSASGTTNGSGQFTATFSSTKAEAKTIIASVGGTTVTTQPTVTVNPDVVLLTLSTFTAGTASITACSTSCVAGSTASTLTATVKDQFSNPISGKTVTPSCSVGTSCTFSPTSGSTNGSGVFQSNFNSTLAQAKTIQAAVTGSGTITQTAGVTVNAAAPFSVSVSNQAQAARITTGVGTRPTYTVFDQFSNPVPTTAFTVAAAGGGSVSPTSGSTNASGQVTLTSWTMGSSGTETARGGFVNTATLTAGSANGVATDTGFYSYANDVQPVYNANCTSCHGIAPILTTGNSYSQTVNVASTCVAGTRIVPSSASTSVLYLRVTGGSCGVMPPSGQISAPQQTILRAWINRSALNN